MSDYASLDYEREQRCGFPEVVYGASKTPEQMCTIIRDLVEYHGVVLATRVHSEAAEQVTRQFSDAHWFERSGILFVDRREDAVQGSILEDVLSCPNRAQGQVLVACAGTSDIAIAEEAALTARIMGSRVQVLADVGVAGVHRTLAHEDDLRRAHAIVVVAGMEGALASLIAGLVDVPVVAVPTSVGYGASFGGIAALLSMLNSCAGGVSVVNIDNGFGAGQIAHRINCPPSRFE
jgi:NCAIR mutase (PurE)-related protein